MDSGYSCPEHGFVEPKAIIETDKWGFNKLLTVCPRCGKLLLLMTKTIKEDYGETTI